MAALQVLADAGRAVPDDVAVVGFDDIADATTTVPPLTTVRQPLDVMTRTATRLLLRRIDGSAEDAQELCPVRLVRRASA